MQLGNRIFPYPVLNRDTSLSEFLSDISFKLVMDLGSDGQIPMTREKLLLNNIHFQLNDKNLLSLFEKGKLKCFLVVESSSSVYRQRFELKETPVNYEISLKDLKDDVIMSAYCIATCDIPNYCSENFNDEYKNYQFQIEKYDIVAADDGIRFSLERDLKEDNKVSSIFVIVKNEELKDVISYDMKNTKIHIYLPSEQHDFYSSLKSSSEWNDIFFSIMAVPVLSACLTELKSIHNNENYSLVDLAEIFRWFKSVLNSYKKETKKDLTEDEFERLQPLELAQKVINYSTVRSISKFYNLVNSVGGGEDE